MGHEFKFVGFAGSSSQPSRTRNLVEAITTTAAKRIGATRFSISVVVPARSDSAIASCAAR